METWADQVDQQVKATATQLEFHLQNHMVEGERRDSSKLSYDLYTCVVAHTNTHTKVNKCKRKF